MRILQIIQTKQLRGAEVFACQLSNNLIRMGHEVKMLALLDGQAKMPFEGDIEVLGVKLGSRLIDKKAWKQLHEIIAAFKPDIVQANAGDTLKYAAFSKKIYGWKAKLIFRNANKMGDFITSRWKWYFNKWLLKEVNYVASVSKECQSDFIKTFNWDPARINTLPIGVDGHPHSTYNPLREKDWINVYPILLHVGGFVPEKNHAGLIRIFKSLLDAYPSAKLIMIGEGKFREQIKKLCEEYKIEDNVWLTGRRSDVSSFMQYAHVLLMPSLIEGLPGVILEAFANKLPVIAYGVGGIPEVVIDETTGVLVAKNDEQSFLSSLKKLLRSDDATVVSIKDNAFALTKSEYNNQAIAERFLSTYRILVPQKSEMLIS